MWVDRAGDLKDKLMLQEKRQERHEKMIDHNDETDLVGSALAHARTLENRLAAADKRLARLATDRRNALAEAEHWRCAASEFEQRVELLSNKLTETATSSHCGDHAEIKALRTEIDSATQAMVRTEHELKARFDEIAGISALLIELESQLAESKRELTDKHWLQATSDILIRIPTWWHFLPTKMRLRREHKKLYKAGLFDVSAYISRYPDVAMSGIDPLKHYIIHGIKENRDRSLG